MTAPQSEDGFTASMEGARPRYQWLVFDADGTLFDFQSGETVALKSTTHRYGVSYSPHLHDVYAAISAELWGRFERGEMPLKQLRVVLACHPSHCLFVEGRSPWVRRVLGA